jgi:hypothetical protein
MHGTVVQNQGFWPYHRLIRLSSSAIFTENGQTLLQSLRETARQYCNLYGKRPDPIAIFTENGQTIPAQQGWATRITAEYYIDLSNLTLREQEIALDAWKLKLSTYVEA